MYIKIIDKTERMTGVAILAWVMSILMVYGALQVFENKYLPVGAYVAGIVGGVGLLITVVLVIAYLERQPTKESDSDEDNF